MDEGSKKPASEQGETESPASTATGTLNFDKKCIKLPPSPPGSPAVTPQLTPTSKGVENAKKRLRAFSIQKKTPLSGLTVPKPVTTGNTTILIGKLSNVKAKEPKVEDAANEVKKPPKPPKPGTNRKNPQEYIDQRKNTLSEIEDMKRKMELVELGIPLGLICPSVISHDSLTAKAMPTKAMPPIKTLLDPAKVDEIIQEAKRAKAAGKKFKFDYRKFLPDYDSPFQKKKENPDKKPMDRDLKRGKDRKYHFKYNRRYPYRSEEKNKYKGEREHYKEKKVIAPPETAKVAKTETTPSSARETDVNLKDYLVCDSWSVDNEDKSNSSPKIDETINVKDIPMPKERSVEPQEEDIETTKIERLQPVIDSFEFEIDPNEDDAIDIFDDASSLEKYSKPTIKKIDLYDSPVNMKLVDENTASNGSDTNDEKFLQSVINEIKEEVTDSKSQDKGLVEYDISPPKDDVRGSVTPELKSLSSSQMSDYSDYKSVESGYKSTESGYKSTVSVDSQYSLLSDSDFKKKLSKCTVSSLETWSFVLKICQPLLFRHDRNKCYKETVTHPKLWYTVNPRVCSCVKDRCIVYDELEMCKMNLVDRVYGCDQISDPPFPTSRTWYPRSALVEHQAVQLSAEDDWEVDDNQLTAARQPDNQAADNQPTMPDNQGGQESKRRSKKSMTPQKNEEIYLDREYQRFMQALTDVSEQKTDTSRSTTPIVLDSKMSTVDDKKKAKKRLSSEGWSQESDVEEEVEKSKKAKIEKDKVRKRKHSSSSTISSSSDDHSKKKKKTSKAKENKKSKTSKRSRLSKEYLKKLKEKQKKKKKLIKLAEESDDYSDEKEKKKKDKKSKKKKLQKLKRKSQKKKKGKSKSSSSSTSSSDSSSTETDSELEKKSRKRKKENDRQKRNVTESQEEGLFDVNILNNIKTERITDDEKQISPRKKPREIINVKELQNDFVGNNIHIKKEVQEIIVSEKSEEIEKVEDGDKSLGDEEECSGKDSLETEFGKENEDIVELDTIPMPTPDDSSQCSQQKEIYEKDESHLRPTSQNSNYSFNDVIANQYKEIGQKFEEGYEQGSYEMYEQLAMAYQNDSELSVKSEDGERQIETVVRARARGEIKCDWRAGDRPLMTQHRPSRWGLKPGEVNIVLTGGSAQVEEFPIRSLAEPQPVYKIQSLANRTDNTPISYDEAYMDTYGALDRLQYGDCFAENEQTQAEPPPAVSSLDERISQVLQNSVLSEVAKDAQAETADKDGPEKGILITKPVSVVENARCGKRVSFADGYKPGQDSDVEEPPVKKKRVRRNGCAWPCPASHPDHVPLWDALPPPPPPPGSPPRSRIFETNMMPNFMLPEPPPGILTF